jgi:hypothetical protein
MKWFFVLLLLLNVVYFGWELDRQTRMDVTYRASVAEVPKQAHRLEYLGESESFPSFRDIEFAYPEGTEIDEDLTSQSTETNEESELREDAILADLNVDLPDFGATQNRMKTDAIVSCFKFGPIADEVQATGVQDWLISNGGMAQMRHTDEQGRQLFWVYLSPEDSRQDAMATIKGFQDKEVRDFRLIVKGNLQNAISMGLFSSQASVNKRLSELKGKGYKPVVVPYSDGTRVYWIDAKVPQDELILGKVFNEHPSRFGSIPVKCTEIAIAPGSS